MTTEVVVMNRGGVALAADSAVSYQVGDSLGVRNSAVKLFMLSKHRPVGVMIYGNSSLFGIPWETILKEFRKELARTHYPTLGEYGEDLIDFLRKTAAQFSEAIQDQYFLTALEGEYRRIEQTAREELADTRIFNIDDLSQTTDIAFVEGKIREAVEMWSEQCEACYFELDEVEKEGMPHSLASEITGRNSGEISELIDQVFFNWEIEEKFKRLLREIAPNIILKDHFPVELFSGLVIVGFGEQEYFPSVQHIEIGGVFGDKLKVRPRTLYQISERTPSRVLCFGDTEMVYSFLDGISSSAVEHLEDAAVYMKNMPTATLSLVENLAPEKREELINNIETASDSKTHEFLQELSQTVLKHRAKVERAIESLTIKELAQVASTFVSLSSFQQQISLDQQTVGGPVDVALISKGDGFIWIDRKHYFQPELNNHFFQTYFDLDDRKEDVISPNERESQDHG